MNRILGLQTEHAEADNVRRKTCPSNPWAAKHKQCDTSPTAWRSCSPQKFHAGPEPLASNNSAEIALPVRSARKTLKKNTHLRFNVAPRPTAFASGIRRISATRISLAILDKSRRTQTTVNSSPVLLPRTEDQRARTSTQGRGKRIPMNPSARNASEDFHHAGERATGIKFTS